MVEVLIQLQLIAHSVATYARSFKGFPERTLGSVDEMGSRKSSPRKYRGRHLVL